MRRIGRVSLCRVGALLLALACGQDGDLVGKPDALADAAPEQRVVLGTGWRAFEARDDGTHVTLVAGPQGAYHVWTSFRSYGFDTAVLRMSLSMRWDDEAVVPRPMEGNVAAVPELDDDGVSARVTLGWPAVVRDPLCQNGRALRMELSVSDGALVASDSRRWILDVPAEHRPGNCELTLR